MIRSESLSEPSSFVPSLWSRCVLSFPLRLFLNLSVLMYSSLAHVAQNWGAEFRKWLGRDRIKVFVADQGASIRNFCVGRQYQVLIIGYERVSQENCLRGRSEMLTRATGTCCSYDRLSTRSKAVNRLSASSSATKVSLFGLSSCVSFAHAVLSQVTASSHRTQRPRRRFKRSRARDGSS